MPLGHIQNHWNSLECSDRSLSLLCSPSDLKLASLVPSLGFWLAFPCQEPFFSEMFLWFASLYSSERWGVSPLESRSLHKLWTCCAVCVFTQKSLTVLPYSKTAWLGLGLQPPSRRAASFHTKQILPTQNDHHGWHNPERMCFPNFHKVSYV